MHNVPFKDRNLSNDRPKVARGLQNNLLSVGSSGQCSPHRGHTSGRLGSLLSLAGARSARGNAQFRDEAGELQQRVKPIEHAHVAETDLLRECRDTAETARATHQE